MSIDTQPDAETVEWDWSRVVPGETIKIPAVEGDDDIAPGPDGSVDILIQHDEPGPHLESNWLPAPTGSFNVTLRAYWPEQSILNGSWTPPPLTRLD